MSIEKPRVKILENIHNLVTYMHGQNYLFNGCMEYLMECLHENTEYNYWFFSGVTGDSFTQLYRLDHSSSVNCLSYDTFNYDLAKKAFDACGYDFVYANETELKADKAKWTREIVAHLDKGVPIITRGFDAYLDDFCVICGYKNDGEFLYTLKGDERTAGRSRNTLDHSRGLLFTGAKKQAPPFPDVFRNAIMAIPTLMTLPPKDGLVFGKPAFDAWADGLLNDAIFEEKDEKKLDGIRWRMHCSLLCIAGTNGCSRGFLEKAIPLCPDMKVIIPLQPIYEKMQQLFEEISAMQGGFWIPSETLRNADSRRLIANKIRDFGKCCDDILGVFASQG